MRADRHRASSVRRVGTGAAAWLALLAAGAGASAQDEPNRPLVPSKSVEISLPAPAARAIRPIASRIELTEQEKTILGDLQDRTEKFDEPALYVMFAIAGRMTKMDPIEWEELDRPAYVNVLADPNRYRVTPLRMRVQVHYVRKLQPGAGLNFSEFWPKDRAVWELDCVQSDTPYQKDKPLRLYSIADPVEFLGQPDEIDSYKQWKYNRGREIRIAGLFFKLLRTRDRDGELRDYPEIIVWQFSRTMPSFGGGTWDAGKLSQLVPLLLLVIALGLGFYFTRRRLARLRQQDRPPPRMRQARQTAGRPQGQDSDKASVDGSVDPDLAAAAEQYLLEHGEADDKDRRH
ncbi:MAG TPA: hypothetical protein VM695_06490 [Phycisphaerae bacterium]|nr:hypothetical protein [Phycisphaerae bacterium]